MNTTRAALGFTLATLLTLGACTGGDMGNTRGGGAAPGQSGGADTGNAANTTGSQVGPRAGATAAVGDTTKRDTTRH